jgi:hypothetical protein
MTQELNESRRRQSNFPEVSEKARERVQTGDEGYPLITAQNAAGGSGAQCTEAGQGLTHAKTDYGTEITPEFSTDSRNLLC